MNATTKKSPLTNPMNLFESMMPKGGLDTSVLGSIGEAGNAWAKSMQGVQEEFSSFVTTRLQHDAEFSQSLCGCTNWQQAMDLQQDWIRDAVAEYSHATQTFTSLGTRLMTDYWSKFGSAATRTEPALDAWTRLKDYLGRTLGS